MDPDADPDWCFRLRWIPDPADPFLGRLSGVLLARTRDLEALGAEIEDLFYAEPSPLAGRRRPKRGRRAAEPHDLSHEYFRSVRVDDYEIALSTSGADAAEATLLREALKAAGFKPNHYRSPECRLGDREGVMGFINSLGHQPCIVLLVSEGYLRDDPETNWYCAWELADAIRRLADGRRRAEQTLLVFKSGAGFRYSSFDDRARDLLNKLAQHFHGKYGSIPVNQLEDFQHYDDFSRHFAAAAKDGALAKFMKLRGSLGSAIDYASLRNEATGQPDFSTLVEKVASALGRTARRPTP